MADIINIPPDPYTHECVVFTAGGAAGFSTSNYQPTTGIMRGQHARVVFMGLESTSIRFHLDGTTPAAACGMTFANGDYLVLDSPASIRNFKGIVSAVAGVGTAYVFFYA